MKAIIELYYFCRCVTNLVLSVCPLSVRLDLELKDHEGSTALWLALQYITMSSQSSVNPFEDDVPMVNGTAFDENSLAAQLIQRGSNPDAPDGATGTLQDGIEMSTLNICRFFFF